MNREMIPLFDTHCHLQDNRLNESLHAVMERAFAAGVTRMLCCGSCEEDWLAVSDLAKTYSCIIPAAGLHPWYIGERTSGWIDTLRTFLESNSLAAIGEIGLDHQISERNDEEQEKVFIAQMDLARELHRPVSVHCRKAWGSLLAFLRKGGPRPAEGVVIHSFGGAADLVPELASFGIHFSFSGSITYDRNRRGREAAAVVPDGLLLVETDSPDIPPQNHEGINEPSTLGKVVSALAEIRKTAIEKIGELTTANAAALFMS